MNIRLLLFVFLISTFSIMTAQNHMDIMTIMQGAHNKSYFGYTVASLDFNHDSYDDLIVCSPEWKSVYPDPVNWPKGRMDIYFGGPGFDNIPDITMLGEYDFQYRSVVNIGDVSGDGFDDLYIGGDEPASNPSEYFLRIYTDGNTAPSEPDTQISYILNENNYLAKVSKLGDVNGDGFYEIGVSIGNMFLAEDFNIIWGNCLDWSYITSSCNYSDSYTVGFSGIGDINNDGYDDFAIGYTFDDPYIGYHFITLYYGNASDTFDNTLVLTQTQAGISKISTPLGDINGDSIDDFMGYQSIEGLNVWFGGAVTDSIPDIALIPSYQGGEFGQGLKHGDINNDGYQDIVGTNYYQNKFCIWMGRPYINGTSDLMIYAPVIPANPLDYFGYGITMGDYNGDGFCDTAVSAPFTDNTLLPDYRGYVYIYSGNGDFVGNDDPLSPPVTHQFTISIYPNPARIHDRNITIKLEHDAGSAKSPIDISIFNIRGQCVQKTHWDGKSTSDTYTMDVCKLPSGVYLCEVNSGNKRVVKKVSIMK